MIPDTKEMSSGTPKIMSLAVPDCLTEPLMVKCSPTCATSGILDLGMNGLNNKAKHQRCLVLVRRTCGNSPNGAEGVKSLGSGPRQTLLLDRVLDVSCRHIHSEGYDG